MWRKTLLLATVLAAWGAQQPAAPQAKPPAPPQQRDLRVEKDVVEAAPAAPRIPRSYALVVGIANYKNLPAQLQLRYQIGRAHV
jgi:hypothetical protein